MNRKQFIRNLSILSLLPILGCNTTQPQTDKEFMGKAEGKSVTTATVEYKIIDKDGNVKKVGTSTMPLDINTNKKEN